MGDFTFAPKVLIVNNIALTIVYQGWERSYGCMIVIRVGGCSSNGTCFRGGDGGNEFPSLTSGSGYRDHEGIEECVGELEVGCGYAVGVLCVYEMMMMYDERKRLTVSE